MSKIKAIFFDIDGTLVSFNTHKVPQSAIDALAELRKKGIKIFVATGRMLSMVNVLDGIAFDGYISYNGAYCVDEQHNEIYANPFQKEDLEALVKHLEHDSFAVSFMGRHEMTVNTLNDRVTSVANHIDVDPPRVEDPWTTIRNDIFQFCIYVDEDKEKWLMENVLVNHESNRWTPLFADVNVKGNTKQSGIDQILKHYNIKLSETMAFGDGGNDIPMLKHAAIGVAMGNAGENVKQAADYITDTVENDGIRNALIHFGLL
jgi:Cof subfamily protein (haloacid dehalogenase superfamily)